LRLGGRSIDSIKSGSADESLRGYISVLVRFIFNNKTMGVNIRRS